MAKCVYIKKFNVQCRNKASDDSEFCEAHIRKEILTELGTLLYARNIDTFFVDVFGLRIQSTDSEPFKSLVGKDENVRVFSVCFKGDGISVYWSENLISRDREITLIPEEWKEIVDTLRKLF